MSSKGWIDGYLYPYGIAASKHNEEEFLLATESQLYYGEDSEHIYARYCTTIGEGENVEYVTNGEMTWQKFYELYDMYGEESTVWDEYKKEKKKSTTINDIVNMAKNIDMDKFQDGINSLSKAVGLFSDLFANRGSGNSTNTYKPRPLYKHFED